MARSPIYDLGSIQHIAEIGWTIDAPPQTRVEIRSRTGNLLDNQYVFYDKNGKQVTERKYDKLIPSFRGAYRHPPHRGSRLEQLEPGL